MLIPDVKCFPNYVKPLGVSILGVTKVLAITLWKYSFYFGVEACIRPTVGLYRGEDLGVRDEPLGNCVG